MKKHVFFTILLTFSMCLLTYAQEKTVTGTILDSEQIPLPGASILVTGTTTGVAADFDGNFSINVPVEYNSLSISYIGYESKTITINNENSFVIVLESSNALDEVVVIGYGSQKREDVTSAIVSVDPKEFNGGSALGVNGLIQGKVAGLNISTSGSDPTSGASVVLRGPSTINGGDNKPFYVIDGVPGSLAGVAPQDIESVEVLKDASAAAIYGARATNGVIIVTTKRPKSGQSYFGYNTFLSSEFVTRDIDVLSASELRTVVSDFGQTLSVEDDLGANTNWQKEITQTGFKQNHLIRFGGGSEKSSFSATLAYIDQTGVVKTSSSEQFRGRIRGLTRLFNDNLTLDVSFAGSRINQRLVDYNTFKNAFYYLPTVPVRVEDGSFYQIDRQEYSNPVSLLELRENTKKLTTFTSIANAKLKIVNGLSANTNILLQNNRTDEADFFLPGHLKQDQFDPYDLKRRTTEGTQVNFDAYLNYNKLFNENNSLDLTTGYTFFQETFGDGIQAKAQIPYEERLGIYGLEYFLTPLNYNSLGGQPRYGENKLISFYGRAIYVLNNKYVFNASIRQDGSTKLGENNKWGNFPAASVAWKVHEEDFLKNSSVINSLKFRVGWGQLGNERGLGNNLSRLVYGSPSRSIGLDADGNQIIIPSNNPDRVENPNLRWEVTTTTNLGVDFGLFNNRLSGSVEVYDKTTTDLLFDYSVPIPPFRAPTVTGNGGELNNKGLEIALNGVIANNKDFGWDTNFNISFNKNEIINFNSDFDTPDELRVAQISGLGLTGPRAQLIRPGQPLGTFYLPREVGIDDNGARLYEGLNGNIYTNGQDLDPNNPDAGKFSPDENLFIAGNAQPDYIFNFGNTFRYKNLSLSFLLRGMMGHDILNATRLNLSRYSEGFVTQRNILQSSVTEGPIGDSPQLSDFFLEDGSYLRLDNVTLAYNLPDFGGVLKNAILSLTGENLFTISNYSGLDPEINLNSQFPGIESFRDIPQSNGQGQVYFRASTITLGLDINF